MIYLTADTHYGHVKMAQLRGFSDTSAWEMDDQLIEKWNKVVGDKDEVYHLGDFSFANWDRTVDIFKRLRGRKHLVYGNHDKPFRNKYKELFESVQDYKHLVVQASRYNGSSKLEIMLMHYPLWRWNKQRYGTIHCHGHIHSKDKLTDPTIKRVDVGVDAWDLTPVNVDQLVELTNGLETPYHHD